MSSISSEASHDTQRGSAAKKRIRNWTKEDRQKHKIIEKSRREAFNESLMKLAALLPALDDSKQSQLSKHVIVHQSIQQHQAQAQELEAIIAERNALLDEVNHWRSLCGLNAAQLPFQADAALFGPANIQDGMTAQAQQAHVFPSEFYRAPQQPNVHGAGPVGVGAIASTDPSQLYSGIYQQQSTAQPPNWNPNG